MPPQEVAHLDEQHLMALPGGAQHDLLPVRRQRHTPILRREADDRETFGRCR